MTIAQRIIEYTATSPDAAPITARELLHLGSRAGVDQALARLARTGALRRIGRGLYLRPSPSRFGERLPVPEQVVAALASRSGELVAPTGAATANALGLTTQVPVQHIYLTSGRSRRLRIGRQVVHLRHAPAWQLRPGPAGEVARVLAWSEHAGATATMKQLAARLSLRQRQEVVAARASLPTWMAEAISGWVRAPDASAPSARARSVG